MSEIFATIREAPAPLTGSIAPAQTPVIKSVSNARGRNHLRTIVALMLREMSSRYGNRPGGYAWAILEPISMILLLAVGFSLLLRAPALGVSFILFYGTGVLPFTLFRDISKSVQGSIGFSRPLMIYPVVSWIDAVLARAILNTLTSLLVSFILLTGILRLETTHAIVNFAPVIEAYLMCAAIGLGVGLVNCVLSGFFPVYSAIWKMVMRPLAIASGVILLYDNMPGWVQDILWYNPLLHAIGVMRTGFYPSYTASYVSYVYVITFSMVLIALGLVLLRRYHREILSRM